jgi:PII-like signaling protein
MLLSAVHLLVMFCKGNVKVDVMCVMYVSVQASARYGMHGSSIYTYICQFGQARRYHLASLALHKQWRHRGMTRCAPVVP